MSLGFFACFAYARAPMSPKGLTLNVLFLSLQYEITHYDEWRFAVGPVLRLGNRLFEHRAERYLQYPL